MKDQVKMRDLCWISCFCCFSDASQCFSCTFHEKCHFSYKKCHFSWKQTNWTRSICVYTCTIYTYHHHIPPKYKIYLVGLPSVLYERPGQNERSVLNQLFLLLFSAFHRKCWQFSYKKCHFSWKPTKPGQYVCIHVPFTHTCTTKYQPKYDIPSWPSLCTLWKTRSKWEICVESDVFVVFQVLFMCFSWKAPLFIQKVPLFMKTNKTRSICVYTCTIYTHTCTTKYHQNITYT